MSLRERYDRLEERLAQAEQQRDEAWAEVNKLAGGLGMGEGETGREGGGASRSSRSSSPGEDPSPEGAGPELGTLSEWEGFIEGGSPPKRRRSRNEGLSKDDPAWTSSSGSSTTGSE